MARENENLGSTGVAVTETRVDRTALNPNLNGTPELVPSGQAGLHGLHAIGTATHDGEIL